MYVDAQLLVSDEQALTATAVSENTIDEASASNDISVGEPICLVVQVNESAVFDDADETYEFQVIESAAANLGSPNVLASRTIDAADLVAGSLHYIPLPPGSKTLRYLGANYVLGGTTPGITVTAFFQPQNMIQVEKVYPDNIVIS